jgi:hypothetical protein
MPTITLTRAFSGGFTVTLTGIFRWALTDHVYAQFNSPVDGIYILFLLFLHRKTISPGSFLDISCAFNYLVNGGIYYFYHILHRLSLKIGGGGEEYEVFCGNLGSRVNEDINLLGYRDFTHTLPRFYSHFNAILP